MQNLDEIEQLFQLVELIKFVIADPAIDLHLLVETDVKKQEVVLMCGPAIEDEALKLQNEQNSQKENQYSNQKR